MERAAVVLRVKPDREDAYRAWLEGSAEQLGDVYARNGIRAKTVLMAGRRFIEHYEADQKEGVLNALSEPESRAIVEGDLADILDQGETGPALHEEIFAWHVPQPSEAERAGLVLTVRAGQEASYRDWLASGVLEELERIWTRNEIYRHDVLAAGTSLVAYYECKKQVQRPQGISRARGAGDVDRSALSHSRARSAHAAEPVPRGVRLAEHT